MYASWRPCTQLSLQNTFLPKAKQLLETIRSLGGAATRQQLSLYLPQKIYVHTILPDSRKFGLSERFGEKNSYILTPAGKEWVEGKVGNLRLVQRQLLLYPHANPIWGSRRSGPSVSDVFPYRLILELLLEDSVGSLDQVEAVAGVFPVTDGTSSAKLRGIERILKTRKWTEEHPSGPKGWPWLARKMNESFSLKVHPEQLHHTGTGGEHSLGNFWIYLTEHLVYAGFCELQPKTLRRIRLRSRRETRRFLDEVPVEPTRFQNEQDYSLWMGRSFSPPKGKAISKKRGKPREVAATTAPFNFLDETIILGKLNATTDPEQRRHLLEKAQRAHRELCNWLATWIKRRPSEPLIGRLLSGEETFDVGYVRADGCCILFEVKSINPGNVRQRVRAAVAQLLEYRYLHQKQYPQTLLCVVLTRSLEPNERWMLDFASSLGIGVAWRDHTGKSLELFPATFGA